MAAQWAIDATITGEGADELEAEVEALDAAGEDEFDEIEPVIVSYSELDTFRQCPLKHFLSYTQRYTKPPKENSALAKGSLYHLVMEEHYREIKKWQDKQGGFLTEIDTPFLLAACAARVAPLLSDQTTGEQTPNQELIEWMYLGYVEQYGIDLDWRILAVEHNAVVPLRDREGAQTHYHLKVKIDLLVRDRHGNIWVIDHKSGKDLPNAMDLEIDDQFGLYSWAMNELGRPVVGSIHSANRTQRNKSFMPLETRMKRTYLNRGKVELANLALDAYEVARAAHPVDPATRVRYSSPDPRQCGWKCDYKEPHLVMRTGQSMHKVMTDYGYSINRARH